MSDEATRKAAYRLAAAILLDYLAPLERAGGLGEIKTEMKRMAERMNAAGAVPPLDETNKAGG